MCITCGCSNEAQSTLTDLENGKTETIPSSTHEHTHQMPDGRIITHVHPTDHASHHHPSEHSDEALQHLADHQVNTENHAHASTVSPDAPDVHAALHGTTITLEQNILSKNDRLAAQNRNWLKDRNILALNLVSSPGAGKTALLTRTIQDLQSQVAISVIEGDQETANDARRIRETGCPVVQINTGTGCHLEASMVERGLQVLDPPLHSIVMIENVGNLVCPALFDLGERFKVAILSVTEGEDKPIKYPHMFRASQVMILTKIDLLPYLQFDVDRCLAYARQVNPSIQIFTLSAQSGEGLNDWYNWVLSN